jgi:peptidoglycan/LPS O-acetylase OafA/YrhL
MSNDTTLDVARIRRPFHTLDGLRGVAAICVAIFHYPQLAIWIACPSGYLAVDLFFLMSGFVICSAYDHKLSAGLSVKEFLKIRVIRLYPVYLVAFLPSVAIFVLHGHLNAESAFGIVVNAMMLPVLPLHVPYTQFYPSNYVAWSILVEIIVNAAYAVAYPVLTNRRLAQTIAMAVVALGCVAVARGTVDGGTGWQDWYVGVVRVLFSFPAGVLICRLHRQGRLLRIAAPPPVLLLATLLLLNVAPTVSAQPIFELVCILVAFPILVLAAVNREPGQSTGLFVFLGLISYPLYLLQRPVLGPATFLAQHFDFQTRHLTWTGPVMLVSLVGLSWIVARYYDPMARRVLGRLAASLDRSSRAEQP